MLGPERPHQSHIREYGVVPLPTRCSGASSELHQLDPVTRAAVKSFEIDKDGAIKYQFW